jgi:hypothetical protein
LHQGGQAALPIPWQFLPLQDYVDLAGFLVTMTSVSQTWTYVGFRSVSGQAESSDHHAQRWLPAVQSKLIQVRDWH